MPTPTGKPRVGERVRFFHKKDGEKTATDGTVTGRSDGMLWSFHVRVDGERRDRIITEAQWMIDHGYLKVLG